MLSLSTRTLLKIKISRTFRRVCKKIKNKINGEDYVVNPDDPFGERVAREARASRSNRIKSTIVVAVASLAIGVSQVATASIKAGKPLSRKAIVVVGVGTSIASSYVWYNYMNAADDGITEDDIELMFEMVDNAGYGKLENYEDGVRAFDIIHTVITGKYDEEEFDSDALIDFGTIEGEEDEEILTEEEEDAKIFTDEVNFEDDLDDDTDDKKEVGISQRIGLGKSKMGVPAFKGPSRAKSRFDDDEDEEPRLRTGFSRFKKKDPGEEPNPRPRKSHIPDDDMGDDVADSWLEM